VFMLINVLQSVSWNAFVFMLCLSRRYCVCYEDDDDAGED